MSKDEINVDVNIDKCPTFKNELREIIKYFKHMDVDLIEIIPNTTTVALKIDFIKNLAIYKMTKLENDYKEFTNYFIEDGKYILKFNLYQDEKEELPEEQEDESVIKYLKETINIQPDYKFKSVDKVKSFNNSSFSKVLGKVNLLLRKLNITSSQTKLTVVSYDDRKSFIEIKSLSNNIPLKKVYEDIKTYVNDEDVELETFNIIDNSVIKFLLKKNVKRKRDEEEEEVKFKKFKY